MVEAAEEYSSCEATADSFGEGTGWTNLLEETMTVADSFEGAANWTDPFGGVTDCRIPSKKLWLDGHSSVQQSATAVNSSTRLMMEYQKTHDQLRLGSFNTVLSPI